MAEATKTVGGGYSYSGGTATVGRVPRFAAGTTDFEDSPYGSVEVAVSISEMKNLVATNKELVPAPGAGKVLQFLGATVIYDYAAAYTESGNNLAVNYTNAAGAVASEVLEGTGLWDATSDQIRHMVPAVVAPVVVANAALTLDMQGSGELGGTGSPVRIKVMYAVHSTGL